MVLGSLLSNRFVIINILTIKTHFSQVQRPIPEPDPEVGDGLVKHQRDPGEMAVGAEHVGLPLFSLDQFLLIFNKVGLPRGRLRRWRHRQAAAQGGQEIQQD